jgi:hypothetical protein
MSDDKKDELPWWKDKKVILIILSILASVISSWQAKLGKDEAQVNGEKVDLVHRRVEAAEDETKKVGKEVREVHNQTRMGAGLPPIAPKE